MGGMTSQPTSGMTSTSTRDGVDEGKDSVDGMTSQPAEGSRAAVTQAMLAYCAYLNLNDSAVITAAIVVTAVIVAAVFTVAVFR